MFSLFDKDSPRNIFFLIGMIALSFLALSAAARYARADEPGDPETITSLVERIHVLERLVVRINDQLRGEAARLEDENARLRRELAETRLATGLLPYRETTEQIADDLTIVLNTQNFQNLWLSPRMNQNTGVLMTHAAQDEFSYRAWSKNHDGACEVENEALQIAYWEFINLNGEGADPLPNRYEVMAKAVEIQRTKRNVAQCFKDVGIKRPYPAMNWRH